jgi:putative restriction endonuclease
MKRSVIAVNITWNRYRWQKAYVDARAGHSYARTYPGHESLNFYFNKKGVDTKSYIHGYSQWKNYPTKYIDGGYVIFFTRNLDSNENQIVGIYGDVKLLKPPHSSPRRGFENNTLLYNLKASRNLSLLLPLPLDAKKYSKGRMVGQIGFSYYDEHLVKKIVSDEYQLLRSAGGFPYNSYYILNNIYFGITGKHLSKQAGLKILNDDAIEQNELEKIESSRVISDILNELKNLSPNDPEQIEIRTKIYKRDNRTIVQLKIIRGYKCQICGTNIRKSDGSYYIEAAHITPKSQKGNELPGNILILCPNHHKEFDLGERKILHRDANSLKIRLNGVEYSINLKI